VNAYDYFARDAGRTTGIPLVDDAPPVVPDEPEATVAPAPLRIWSVVALLWYIVHMSIVGAAYIYVMSYPLESADKQWQAIPLGAVMALLLWALTLTVRRLARQETA
jgi:hypothetical protein